MTTVQIELWQLLTFGATLLLAFLGCVFAGAKWFIETNEKRLSERFATAAAATTSLHEHLARHVNEEAKMLAQVPQMERDFLNFKADLPLQYVRREDYIRGQSVIESKLDALALRIENAHLRKGIA